MASWNLDDIYPPAQRETLVRQLKEDVEDFKKLRPKLDDSLTPKSFTDILLTTEQITVISEKLAGHAGLRLSENTLDSERNANEDMISELCADMGNQMLFFSLWFKDLDDKRAAEYVAAGGPRRYVLERIRAFKPHTLGEREEQVINLKDLSGIDAVVKLYDLLTNRMVFDFDGRKLTHDELNAYKMSPDRGKRKAAYDLLLGTYAREQDVLAEVYRNIVNDWRNENLKLRGFRTPISVRNLANDLPDDAVGAMLKAVSESSVFRDYFKLKAKLLELTEMDRYDLYAPFKGVERKYSFKDCVRMTLETYKSFDEGAYRMAKRVFDERHIHSDPAPNKQRGAFCYTVTKDTTPYILTNHAGRLEDLYTLVHETGHAIHSMAAAGQTELTFRAPLPLAETASLFGEMLLTGRLLEDATEQEKTSILVKNLDARYASIARQAHFTLYEMQAHRLIAEGATVDDLNQAYLTNLRRQFAKTVTVPDIFQHEWKYVGHIYSSPFYCYSYTFGNLLVMALYRMYVEEGDGFKPKYMKLLSLGGSDSPAKMLATIGIDATKKGFWRKGLEAIEDEVRQLKKLTN